MDEVNIVNAFIFIYLCSLSGVLSYFKLLDWIFEEGELDFLPKTTIQEFIKNRFNLVLASGGFTPVFETDPIELEKTDWLEVQLKSEKEDDFFYKVPVAYNKNAKSITEDDLF